MSPLAKKLAGFFAALPAILLMTFINVFICFTVAGTVMLELLAGGGSKYPYLCLGTAILVAIGVHCWIVFNHKLRAYIKQQGNVDE